MKIIKKFRDYYDSCLGYGIDEELVFVRFQELPDGMNDDVLKKAVSSAPVQPYDEWTVKKKRDDVKYYADYGYIGFCGRVYPFICITHGASKTPSTILPPKRSFHYDFDSLKAEMVKHKLTFYEPPNAYRKYGRDYAGWRFSESNLQTFFEPWEDQDIFFEIGQPTFAVYSHENFRGKCNAVANPCLVDFEFYKKVDSYTAFQELSMFLSGVLGQSHPPMDTISDKDMAVKKGFGHKYAFRTPPSKGKS